MKLATDFGLEAPSRQIGVWDSDDGDCIITHPDSDPPTVGCIGGKESTVYGVVDLCGFRGSGDGKCEQACGADAACDEMSPNDLCISGGKFGRCSDYCSCCVASDSDNGKDYLKKGTATGLMFEGGYRNCSTKTDSCVNDVLIEYYINSSGHLNYESHYCGNEENKKCVDGHCGCEYDSDCPANQDNVKGKCDIDGSVTGKPKTCYWPKCKYDSDCVSGNTCYCGVCSASFTSSRCPSGQCCNKGYGYSGTGAGECVSQGTIYNNIYLCDPPEWNSDSQTQTTTNKNIFESILDFFSHFFQR